MLCCQLALLSCSMPRCNSLDSSYQLALQQDAIAWFMDTQSSLDTVSMCLTQVLNEWHCHILH